MELSGPSPQLFSLLADFILLIHFGFVAFVLLGLIGIWVGYFRGWSFIRNFWFRCAHLLAITIVATEAIGGIVCPLTRWEMQCRWRAGADATYAGSFMEHWVHKIMFFDIPESVFTLLYSLFFLAVALSFWIVRPRFPHWGSAHKAA
jgi:hypothetical protein